MKFSVSRVLAVALVVGLSLPASAWDTTNCGPESVYTPDSNCTNERCCQCNYQYDLKHCGSDEWCKKGALATLEACNKKVQSRALAVHLAVLDTSGVSTWEVRFESREGVQALLWILNGNGGGGSDPYGVATAEVRLNGEVVATSSDVRADVGELTRAVRVLEGVNVLSVTATGNPGDTLTLAVYDEGREASGH